MSRRAPRAGVLVLLLGALCAAAGAGTAAADLPAAGRLTAATVDGGQLRFVLSASGLSGAAPLEPASLRVTVDGMPVAATAASATSSSSPAAAAPAGSRTVLIVLDTSGSMAGGGLAAARHAAADFARRLPADVRVGLITFADRVDLAVVPGTDRVAFTAALAATRAAGGTALYDAVSTGLATLDRAGTAAGSVRHLVVLSDGRDTASRVPAAALRTRLAATRVKLDVVAFRFDGDLTGLRRLASASGGSVLPAADPGGLASAFATAAVDFEQRLAVTVPVPAGLAGRQVRVEARVAAGDRTVLAAGTVAIPAAATADAGVPGGGPARWPLWAVAGLVFAGVLGPGLLAAGLVSETKDRQRRLAQLEVYRLVPGPGDRSAAGGTGSPVSRATLAWIDRLVTARGVRQVVEAELDRAGLALKVQEWMLLRACACAALAAVLVLVTGSLLVGLPLGVALGWLGSRLVLSVRASRRCAAFAAGLPDLLQLVAGSLRSGFSLPQALDTVVRDGSQPVAGEISRALAGARLGVDLEDGLDAVAERMRCRDLSWVVMAIRIQRSVGGNLADVLTTTVQTMRERVQVQRQVRALTAEGRLSAYILVALPIGIGGFLFLVRPEYMRPLVTEPMGLLMLVVAGLLVGIGSFWLSRLVKVEV